MAKILAPYALCPLTERKKFVGVSPDSESGCVIVTLSRNIVIRYRLSNQKQVGSWSTKAMLSAPVTYDHASKLYYGVFNNDEVSAWDENAVSLGKLSKTKFIWLIHSIVSSEDCPAIIVYKNGIISPLKTDIVNSKNPPDVEVDQLLSSNETVKDARLVSLAAIHYVAIYSCSEEGYKLYLSPVDQDRGTRSCISMVRRGVTLTAYTVLDGDTPHLMTLWSDGELYSLSLPMKNTFPGQLISKIQCIDASQPAVLLQLGQEHIVLYGAAPNSEGAQLVILSRQFGLPESTTKMKVYDNECRMWTCRNNIVLVMGGYLVVAPFKLNTVKLVSLLGVDKSKKAVEESYSSVMDNTVDGIVDKIKRMREEGNSEYDICDEMITGLLDTKNAEGLTAFLDNICDIRDKWLVRIMFFALEEDESLLRNVLRLPLVGDNSSVILLRQKLMLTSALKLVTIITNLLKEDEVDKCILDWATLLCDAHYLQCLLSKDDQVISAIRQLQDAVEEHIEAMVTYRSLLAEINYFRRGKLTTKKSSVSTQSYVVEKIKLY